MSKVCVFDHPLIQHKLSILRDKDTSVKEFRELVSEIAMLMCYEATRDLPLEEVTVETPVAPAKCMRIAGKKLAVVPILLQGALGSLYGEPEAADPLSIKALMDAVNPDRYRTDLIRDAAVWKTADGTSIYLYYYSTDAFAILYVCPELGNRIYQTNGL